MKPCSSCGREIPETATVCGACEAWASSTLVAPAADPLDGSEWADFDAASATDAPPPLPTAAPSPVESSQPTRRPLMLTVVGGIALTIAIGALLASRNASSAEVAAAPTAETAGTRPAAAAPRRTATGSMKWSTDNRALWVGKSKNAAAFELAAENIIATWTRPFRPALVVRCVSGAREVFVVTGSTLQMESDTDDHSVTFGFDDEPQRTERWPDGAEHDALFAPDGAAFAGRLTRARTLRFQYTPHNAPAVTAHFNAAGLAEAMSRAARECGAKK